MSKSEGVTVFTVTPNPKSRCPLLCQLLGTLCCSASCTVSGIMKQELSSSHTVIGALQILVGVMNLGFGGFIRGLYMYSVLWDFCFGLGAVYIAAGILCILVAKFPSQCLIGFSVLLNVVNIAMAITATVFYSMDLSELLRFTTCEITRDSYDYGYGYRYPYYTTTTVPTTMNDRLENCESYKYMLMIMYGGLDIMMILLGILELCLTISSCVLSLKSLCKKNEAEETEDPELQKPLLEEVISSPAC